MVWVEGVIQLPCDGEGKFTRQEVVHIDGRDVYQQVVTLTDRYTTLINPATAENQLNGDQKTRLVDPNGLQYTTANPLPVDATLTGATVYTVPPFCFASEYIGNQTATVMVTPPLGKQLEAIGCFVTGQSAVFDLKIHFASGQTVQQHFVNGTLGAYIPTKLAGNLNEPILLTITGSGVADKWFVVVNYQVVPI